MSVRDVRHLLPNLRSRVFIAIFLSLGWLVATNHCALGLMRNGRTAMECPGHPHSADAEHGPKPASLSACCQTIQGAVFAGLEMDAKPSLHALLLPFFGVALISTAESDLPPLVAALDTGPPFCESFAETVLQRSLFGNAPPLV